MMKNFANFTLWFMVLFAIIKSIITNSGEWSLKDEKSPLGIIKTTLIAGILIQASWFLLAALIDVSTIATYAVGGLPLSVLKNTDIGEQKILTTNSAIDLDKFDLLNEEWESFKVRYSTTYKDGETSKPVHLSPCKMEGQYVVGRLYTEKKYRNTDIFEEWISACVAFGKQIVLYNEFPSLQDKDGVAYKNGVENMLGFGLWSLHYGTWEWLQACGYIIPTATDSSVDVWSCGDKFAEVYAYITDNSDAYNVDDYQRLNTGKKPINTPRSHEKIGSKWWTNWFDSKNVIAMTMSDLISKSQWFVWPLVTIYASLLNFAQLTDDSTTTIGETSWIFIIKTAVALALIFPLVALTLVLIARIGVLRLYIVASPFIVLKATFSKFLDGKWMDALGKYLDISSVVKLVFAPVVTVAALSISLIFMTALTNGFQSGNTSEGFFESLWLTKTTALSNPAYEAITVEEVSTIEFSKLPWGNGLDWFSWLLLNCFAIGLMRMVLFAAIKANALGEVIGQKVQDFGGKFLQTLPILPIGQDGNKVGIGTAASAIGNFPDQYIAKRKSDQTGVIDKFIEERQNPGTTQITSDIATQVITPNATSKETIIQWFVDKGIREKGISETLDTNTSVIYDARNKITEPQAKEDVKKAIIAAGVTQANWTAAETASKLAPVKKALDELLTSKKPKTQADIDAIFADTDPANKKIVDDYFAVTDDYTIKIEDIEYIINKTDKKSKKK